ncbi:unnamed protein product, partial [Laminaria digitata]
FLQENCDRIILVSSPTHLPRCLRDACSLGQEEEEEEERRRRWRPVILASPSGTSYADYGPDDVAIVEPPHRGD